MWRWGASLGALGAALAMASAAIAQTGSTPAPPAPPVVPAVDAQGVDLVTGQFSLGYPALSIGPSGRALSRSYTGPSGYLAGGGDSLIGFVTGGVGYTTTVTIGSATDAFTPSGTGFVSATGDGATLTYDASYYRSIYTAKDGTVAQFNDEAYYNGQVQSTGARLTSLEHATAKWRLSRGRCCISSSAIRRCRALERSSDFSLWLTTMACRLSVNMPATRMS